MLSKKNIITIKGEEMLISKVRKLIEKNKYEEALVIDPSSSYARTQIKECERLERQKGRAEAEKEYRKIVDAADRVSP